MNTTLLNTDVKAGTLGGILTVLLTTIGQDAMHMAVMTGVGAIVSFTVSIGLNALVNRFRKKT